MLKAILIFAIIYFVLRMLLKTNVAVHHNFSNSVNFKSRQQNSTQDEHNTKKSVKEKTSTKVGVGDYIDYEEIKK